MVKLVTFFCKKQFQTVLQLQNIEQLYYEYINNYITTTTLKQYNIILHHYNIKTITAQQHTITLQQYTTTILQQQFTTVHNDIARLL